MMKLKVNEKIRKKVLIWEIRTNQTELFYDNILSRQNYYNF